VLSCLPSLNPLARQVAANLHALSCKPLCAETLVVSADRFAVPEEGFMQHPAAARTHGVSLSLQ
jgi:hypothetical protein